MFCFYKHEICEAQISQNKALIKHISELYDCALSGSYATLTLNNHNFEVLILSIFSRLWMILNFEIKQRNDDYKFYFVWRSSKTRLF